MKHRNIIWERGFVLQETDFRFGNKVQFFRKIFLTAFLLYNLEPKKLEKILHR